MMVKYIAAKFTDQRVSAGQYCSHVIQVDALLIGLTYILCCQWPDSELLQFVMQISKMVSCKIDAKIQGC